MAVVYPDLASEWHPELNGPLTPKDVVAGGKRKVWWKCGAGHAFQATIENRINGRACPACTKGWTVEALRGFVASLKDHLHAFTSAELYLIFLHNRLLTTAGKGKTFVKALATGRFPKEEIAKFVNSEPSLVDQFVQDPTQTLETLETNEAKTDGEEDDALDRADVLVEPAEEEGEPQLPVIETKDVLVSLGLQVISSADEEAVEFLIASGVAKIWKHAYRDEAASGCTGRGVFAGKGTQSRSGQSSLMNIAR